MQYLIFFYYDHNTIYAVILRNKMKDVNNEDNGRRRCSSNPASRWKTPPLTNHFQESPKTSLLFAAQSRAYSSKQLTQQASTSSGQTPRLCRTNPFEDISSLEFDKCSPGLFIVHQSSAEKGEFKWSIEDISRIMPAQIESPISFPEECLDEETENAAQEAIERYFSFRHAVVSPPDACVETLPSPEMSTPPAELLMARTALGCWRSSSVLGHSGGGKGMISAISSTPCARSAVERRLVIKTEASTQTQLSLPAVLPPELEAALRPFILNKDDQNSESEECNISNTTLRRKLFFNKEDNLSPVNGDIDYENFSNSPVQGSDNRPSRIEWTPDENTERPQLYCLSSPDISPIKFKSKFEFTKDMSVESSPYSCDNMKDAVSTAQPLLRSPTVKVAPLGGGETYHHTRNIFSSTVQSSQIDRMNKDTGYSTMEGDTTPSLQGYLISNKT